MKYTELKNDIAVSDRRIYLFEGEDAYFRAHGEEQVKRAFLSMPELNFASFDGGALKGRQIENLTSAMAAYPFMAEKRVIRVGEFYPSEADYDKYLKAAFENCPPSTILVIVNQSAGKGAQLKRKKFITYVDCSRADEDTVTRWVYATLKRAGIYADVSACRNVAAYCLCDMSRVEGEVEKLKLLGKDRLSAADIDETVYKDTDYRIYEMTEAAAAKNHSRFCAMCAELVAKNTDKSAICAALLRFYKNLLIILTSDESNASLAAKLKMPEFAVRKNGEKACAIGVDRLLYYTRALYDCSARMRSGGLTQDGAFITSLAAVLFGE